MKFTKPEKTRTFRAPRWRFVLWPTRCKVCSRLVWWERVLQRYFYREVGWTEVVLQVIGSRYEAYCDECWPEAKERLGLAHGDREPTVRSSRGAD